MAENSKDTQTTTEDDGSTDDIWGEALAEQKQAKQENNQESDPVDTPGYQPAEFQDLEADSANRPNDNANLDMILDIPVTISLEIGRAKISIRNLMQLNQGSVVELDRLAGEPLDVLVNDTLIAHGEVVMVNEKFGIRLTDVISAAERVQNLK